MAASAASGPAVRCARHRATQCGAAQSSTVDCAVGADSVKVCLFVCLLARWLPACLHRPMSARCCAQWTRRRRAAQCTPLLCLPHATMGNRSRAQWRRGRWTPTDAQPISRPRQPLHIHATPATPPRRLIAPTIAPRRPCIAARGPERARIDRSITRQTALPCDRLTFRRRQCTKRLPVLTKPAVEVCPVCARRPDGTAVRLRTARTRAREGQGPAVAIPTGQRRSAARARSVSSISTCYAERRRARLALCGPVLLLT